MTVRVNKEVDPRLTSSNSWRQSSMILLPVIILAIGSYFYKVVRNPPGYYIDESSISYNAYTISQTGQDEFGTSFPLYFRAFGDYKNPIYIYIIAFVFRLTGPSILAARLVSATVGVLAALALGLLGLRLTKNREVGLILALSTLLTPWIFEMSRVVMEVALYPLVLTLFLLCVHRASTKDRWSWRDVLCLAGTLALITYTYSIGRLLGPALSLGLLFFVSRTRRSRLLLTYGFYVLLLLPLIIFNRRHPETLLGRFYLITYLKPQTSYFQTALEFGKHYFGNFNPRKLFITGDPNYDQIAHLYGMPLLLAATGILILISLWVVLRQQKQRRWWLFIAYSLAASVVPASLTKEYVHMLRLVPLVIFLLLLTLPALEWLSTGNRKQRVALSILVFLMVFQAAIFQWQFYTTAHSQRRLRQFDNGYRETIFARAVAAPERPIHIADALAIPGYIQAYWYATLSQIPISDFVRMAPDQSAPEGAVVITTEETCPRCLVLSTSEFYKLYLATGEIPKREPLSEGGFRAAISVVMPLNVLAAGHQATLRVTVKNESNALWIAKERSGGQYQVSLGNHWLDRNRKVIINDDGRAALLKDLRPGEQVELNLTINAPEKRDDYFLELDLLQEGVSWFGLKGSPTLLLPVRVE